MRNASGSGVIVLRPISDIEGVLAGQLAGASLAVLNVTPGSARTISGPAVTAGRVALNADGDTLVAGINGSGPVGELLEFTILQTLPRARPAARSQAFVVMTGDATNPVNVALPGLSGPTIEGETVTASAGRWRFVGGSDYAGPFEMQLRRNSASGPVLVGWTAFVSTLTIPVGASPDNVVLQVRPVGSPSSVATSAPFGPITAAIVAPTNTVPPEISGTPAVGETLTCSTGTWTGTAPITYAFQWQRGPSASGPWADIAGATASTYTLVAADDGQHIRCGVTATNVAGSATADAASVGPVASASEPLASPRSIAFADRNGVFGRRHWLNAPAWTDLFRSGSARANGVLGITVWQRQQGLRGIDSSGSTTDRRIGQYAYVANGTADSTSTVYLGYYGAAHTVTGRRNRFYVRLTAPGPSTVEALSEEFTAEEPVRVLIVVEGTQLRVDLLRLDGTYVAGAPADASAWNGIASPAACRIGSDTRAGHDSLFSSAKGSYVSDLFFARRAPTAADRTALAEGQTPDSVFGSDLDSWWRMWGPADLAQTGGAVARGALTLANAGGQNVRPGPSIWWNGGTRRAWARVHGHGYVAGFAAGGPYSAAIPVYIRNGGGGATHFEARACVWQDGATTWRPWTRVTATPLADGAEVLVDLPGVTFSDWLTIEVRREDDPAIKSCTERCGVGPKVVLCDGPSTVEIPAGTIPAIAEPIWNDLWQPDALVSACVNMTRIGLPGNTPHVILEDVGQLGSGLHGFAVWWRQLCTNLGVRRVCHVMNYAVAGAGRWRFYNDEVLSGSYLYTGDGVTAGSGRVTDVLLRSCARTSQRDITAIFLKPGSQDLGVASQLEVRLNAWLLGSPRDGDGLGGSGPPPRHHGQFNLLHPLHCVFVMTPRYLGGASDNTSSAGQAAIANTLNNWRNNLDTVYTNAAYSKEWATFSNDLAFDESGSGADKVHHGNRILTGTPRFFGRMAYDVMRLANLLPTYQPRVMPPATFAINGARNTITVTWTAANGGSFATGSGGPTVGGMEISTDGGTTWEMIDGTLSGSTVTYTGDWSAVSDANLRLRWLRGRWPAVVAASTSNPDQYASIIAENALLPNALYETIPAAAGAPAWIGPGVPTFRSEANMTPAP